MGRDIQTKYTAPGSMHKHRGYGEALYPPFTRTHGAAPAPIPALHSSTCRFVDGVGLIGGKFE